MKLIDADELLSIVRHMTVVDKSVMHRVLVQMPPVDAVPVVRCGECKYLMPDNHCTMFADDRIRPSSSDFCSAGERKDGDGNE